MLELDHILLRPMRESDIAQVLAIERQSHFDAWDRTFLRQCLQSKHTLIIELHGKLAAYAVFSIEKNVTTLLNLTVALDFRRHGLGRYLLDQVLKHSLENDAQTIRLTVACSNEAACQLYRSAGFKDVDRLYFYYQTRTYWEDAIVMEKNH